MTTLTIAHRPIRLEAVDPARNIARRYTIITSEDLFGHVLVECSWGRIGTRGQRRTRSFDRHADADRFVAQCLRRRAAAPKRIGVAYREAGEGAGIARPSIRP